MLILADEYKVTHTPAKGNTPSRTECWLESKDDCIFEILLLKTPNIDKRYKSKDWRVVATVDGRELSGRVMKRPKTTYGWSRLFDKCDATGVISGRRLAFARPETTDDARKATISGEVLSKLGMIGVTMEPGEYTYSSQGPPKITSSIGVVSEKDMKKLGRCVGTADGDGKVADDHSKYRFTSATESIYHEFIFRYRPKATLEIMRIIEAPDDESDDEATAAPAIPVNKPKTKRAKQPEREAIMYGYKPIDLDLNGQDTDLKPAEIVRMAKRIKYLEDLNAELAEEKNRSETRKAGLAAKDAIDLSMDDDDD